MDCDETASAVEISAHFAEAILVVEGHQGYLRPKLRRTRQHRVVV